MTEGKKDENVNPKTTVWRRDEQQMRVADSGGSTINVSVTAYSARGGRDHMEDRIALAYHPVRINSDLSAYAFAGVFDGHGGTQAAVFTKAKLMTAITENQGFWSDCDDVVLEAIRDGFLNVHNEMSKEQHKWPRTLSNHPCTAGTTASILFIRNGKIYTGHVGDSRIVLASSQASSSAVVKWNSTDMTVDHKPENEDEKKRIEESGGRVMARGGIARVAWRRPTAGHCGPIRRSTPVVDVPFLSVARSLGDFWSYNQEKQMYVVSPEPDVSVLTLDPKIHRCFILASDGLWGVMSSQDSVRIVQGTQGASTNLNNDNNQEKEDQKISNVNYSARLGQIALRRWKERNPNGKGDNVSVITIMIDYSTKVDEVNDSFANVVQIAREEICIDESDQFGNVEENVCSDTVVSSSDVEFEPEFSSLETGKPMPDAGNNALKEKSPTLQSQVVSSSTSGAELARASMDMVDAIKLRRRRPTSQFYCPPPKRQSRVRKSAGHGSQLEFPRPPKVIRLNEADSKTFSASTERGTEIVNTNVRRTRRGTTEIMKTPLCQSNEEETKKIPMTENKTGYSIRFHGTRTESADVITPILPAQRTFHVPKRIQPSRLVKVSVSEHYTPKLVRKRKSTGYDAINKSQSRSSLLSLSSTNETLRSGVKRRHTVAAAKTTFPVVSSPLAKPMMTRNRFRQSQI